MSPFDIDRKELARQEKVKMQKDIKPAKQNNRSKAREFIIHDYATLCKGRSGIF